MPDPRTAHPDRVTSPAMEPLAPSALPAVDEVEVVTLVNMPARGARQYMLAAIDAPATRLDGPAAQRLAGLWRALPPGTPAHCHLPPYGLRFCSAGQTVCEASVCWQCNNIYGDAQGRPVWYAFDAAHGTARALLAECAAAAARPARPRPPSPRFNVVWKSGDSAGLPAKFTGGGLTVGGRAFVIDGRGSSLAVAFAAVRSVELLGWRGSGRLIEVAHDGGTLSVRVVRMTVLGPLAIGNSAATGHLYDLLRARQRPAPTGESGSSAGAPGPA